MTTSLYQAVLFDLDGTVLNTAPDIINACRHTLSHFGYTCPDNSTLMTRVTAGMREMMKLGIPRKEWDTAPIETTMRNYFADFYTSHICIKTTPFAGIESFIEKLANLHIKTAIITNKYKRMADELLRHFGFASHFSLVLGCDSLTHSKPHPEPLLTAMKLLSVEPEQTIYVGDHINDIRAAASAGCKSCAALWGYGTGECGDPSSWKADFYAENISALEIICFGSKDY